MIRTPYVVTRYISSKSPQRFFASLPNQNPLYTCSDQPMDDPNDRKASAGVRDRDDAESPGSAIDQDTMFEALAHERRRYLLYTLKEDEAWSLLDLARKLAAWEADVSKADVDEAAVERTYASLYHAHVPKLAEIEIIEFDRETETLTRGQNAEQLLNVLELTGGSEAVSLETHARSDHGD